MSSARNNQARLKAPAVEAPPKETKEQPEPAAPTESPLSFAVPTEFVDLPSKGLYYPAFPEFLKLSTYRAKFALDAG